MSDPNSIEVKRRRQTGSSGPQGRAEGPERQRPAGPSGGPTGGGGSAGGGYSGGGSSGRPTFSMPGGRKLPTGVIIVIIIVIVLIQLCSNRNGTQTYDTPSDFGDSAYQELPTEEPFVEVPTAVRDTATPRPTRAPSAGGDRWLIMMYQDADDQILEQDIYVDLNEAERVGSSEDVQIVAQIDRFRSAYSGDGNWTSTRRYFVEQDNDLSRVGSSLVEDLGEVNMADGQTLVDFVTWAVEKYPADRYVLILSDHGMGWPGGWSDPAPAERDGGSAPITQALPTDYLYLNELDDALGQIRSATGLERFEMIGMDACLMAHLEVMEALRPHARYMVASQETEPSLGWAYASFLEALEADPSMDGADLGRLIVSGYINSDQRIVDDQARAELLRQGSPMGGFFGGVPSAGDVTRQMEQGITLSAVDLDQIPAVTQSLDQLALALQDSDQRLVARARSYARSYTSVWGSEVPASYLDLVNFVQLLRKETSDTAVADAAQAVVAAVRGAVVAEKHGAQKNGSNGISIYFPNSTLYQNPVAGARSYTAVADRFARASLWDDFLAYHYTNRSFQAQSGQGVVPSGNSRAPAAGVIEVSALKVSASEVAPGGSVRISATIDGQNIGYIYLFVGIYDQASNSIYVADNDYLESPETREVEGVYYPQWDESKPFTINLDWEPTVFGLTDGVDTISAVFNPVSYGATFEETVYTVDGMYTPVDGETRYARLYFRNGEMFQAFGFTSQDATGSPREITPQSGDTFTVLQKWFDLDSSGNVAQTATQEGGTLTFGSDTLRWQEQYAAAGQYLVGFLVSDLDGKVQPAYAQVTVR